MASNNQQLNISAPANMLDGTLGKASSNRNADVSIWPKIRLGVLLTILIPLSIFGYFRMRYTNAKAAIQKALVNHDDLRAIALIKQLEQDSGMTAETCFLKARAYRHMGDDASFAQYLELAAQLGFPEKKVYNERMLRAAQLGELGSELTSKMESVLAGSETEFEEAACSLIYGYLDANQISNVFPVLVLWSNQDKNTPWVPYFYGMLAQSQRDWAKSLEAFGQAAKANSDFVPLYRPLGVSYQKTNEHEKAIEAFRKYLQSNPNDSEVVAMLSTSLISLDQKDEGLQLLVPFLESNEATDEMRLTAANIYLDRNEPQRAIDVLGSISKLWPEDVGVATLMSQANQRVGNIEAAKKFSDVVAAGQPELQKIDAQIGELQRGIGDTAENNYQLGHTLLHKRSREEGVIWLKQAITRDPQYVKAYEDIVIYFTRTNQTEMATRYQQFVNSLKGTP